MVVSCCAYGCTNRYGKMKEDGTKKLSFHRFPWKNHLLLLKWIAAVRRKDWMPTKVSLICGEHFSEDSYRTSCQTYLKTDAVPSIFNFSPRVKKPRKKRQIITEEPSNIVTNVGAASSSHSEDTSKKVRATHHTAAISPNTGSAHVVKIVSPTKEMLQREVLSLERKLRQKDSKIAELESLLRRSKKHCKMSKEIAAILKDTYG